MEIPFTIHACGHDECPLSFWPTGQGVRMQSSNLVVQGARPPRVWKYSLLWGVSLALVLHLSGFWPCLMNEFVRPRNAVAGELTGPQANDRQIALMVSQLLQGEHLTKHALDDEMSRRALKLFVKQLDPMKVYF